MLQLLYNAGMSRGEEKAQPWQFRIRGLLFVTALVATVTGFYCIHPGLGFFLTVIMMALWGGRLLRQESSTPVQTEH